MPQLPIKRKTALVDFLIALVNATAFFHKYMNCEQQQLQNVDRTPVLCLYIFVCFHVNKSAESFCLSILQALNRTDK